jgi:hypothetical protein
MRLKLASAVDLTDTSAVVRAVDSTGKHDLTLSNLATKLNADKPVATARPGLGEEHRAVAGEAQGPQMALCRRPQ